MLGFEFGSLKCVTSLSSWAPHGAGIMAAASFERVDEEIHIMEGPRIGGREEWDGWRVILTGDSFIGTE